MFKSSIALACLMGLLHTEANATSIQSKTKQYKKNLADKVDDYSTASSDADYTTPSSDADRNN